MTDFIPNPAWVNRILHKHWNDLEDVAPKIGGKPVMPTPIDKRGDRMFEELGCGLYGCVIASAEERVVFKLTSDPSEAAFVAGACRIGEFPPGIIRYYKLVELPETYRERRVFALWREEAGSIGFPLYVYRPGYVEDRYTRDAWKELSRQLKAFLKQAEIVRKYMMRAPDAGQAMAALHERGSFAWDFVRGGHIHPPRGAARAAVALQHCKDLAEEMEHTYAADTIGGALSFYIEHGMLLADVHDGNVGVVTRAPDDDYDDWHAVNVITDPGHMVPLEGRWLSVPITRVAA